MSASVKTLLAPLLCMLVLGAVGCTFIASKETTQTTTESPSTSQPLQNTTAPSANAQESKYAILSKEDKGTVENYYLLIYDIADASSSAQEVRSQCKKQCNVSVYDDIDALNLDKENLNDITKTPAEKKAWEKEHYIFIADHFIGEIMFGDDSFWEYPYKDWYYKELKAKSR